MARRRSRVLDFLVYLGVRLGCCFVQMLSWRGAFAAARFFAWLGYRADRRHREVALDNLRHAFPEMTEGQREDLARRTYRHFSQVAMEIALIPRKLHFRNHARLVSIDQREAQAATLLLSGRPALFLTGHLGNWEAAGFFLGLIGIRSYAVARVLDNPYLEKFLLRFRQKTGQKILAKRGDFDRMTEVLAQGGLLATLGDQDAGQRGLFVDFFGRPASTHKAIALMALEHEVHIVVNATVKIGEPFRYSILVEDVIDPGEYRDRPDAVLAITQRFTAAFERLIRRFPEQYFWLHRRWKHQPVARRRGKKAA